MGLILLRFKFPPRWFCSPRWPNKWYQSRWLIGLVLRSIYEKHRKSSRQGGSSGESRGVVRRCDGQILECGEGAKKEGELNAQCGDSHLRGRLLRFKCEWALKASPTLKETKRNEEFIR
ncbi:hypothetical protein PIB30_045063 [Stylosanthes scabra]|uniref:Uncharacterized protein n=1 Tax=Stylosanthes scabra TaxID=79078 RepID=A0ABU6UFA7_9FABA|nr:hypothetical protein [Stylosanthes scabra]